MARELETHTDYRYPYRPLPVAMFNALARSVAKPMGFGALDVGAMMAAARSKTGLHDFGDEWFVDALKVLVASVNEEAELTPLGRLIQGQRLVGALAHRLRAEELLRSNPEIHDIEIDKVVLIAGLQRTGTTTLHRLVASNPCMRSLMAWEALNPLPLRGEGRDDAWRRKRRAKAAQRSIAYLAPALFAVHPIQYDAPEEDIFLLDTSFMSQTPEATMRVPSYARWLEAQDHTRAYEYVVQLLKILHWQRPGRAWVLKTPNHLEHLDVVLRVFPNATIVQTHRDPVRALGSFCSMVAHGRGLLSDQVDPGEIYTHWLRKVQRMVERSMGVRDAGDPGKFVDVSYYDLIEDPVGQLRSIYHRAGIAFGSAMARGAEQAAAESRQRRHGRHVYEAGSFALDIDLIERRFAPYRARFDIPQEPFSPPAPWPVTGN